MATIIDICNTALYRAEVSAVIDDLSADTPEAQASQTLYHLGVDHLLSLTEWPFATKRAALALLPPADQRPDWRSAYALPSDCLVPRDLYPRQPFAIEGSHLLTDASEATLRYTARIGDPALFPALFVDALAWHLAADFALAIGKNRELEHLNRARFEMALSKAKAQILGAQRRRPAPRSEYEY